MSVKVFGDAREERGDVYACVAPMLVDMEHPLYAVNGVYNGILVEGNKVEKLMFFGSGAGKLPTASAVAADVVEAVKFKNTNLPIYWSAEKLELSDFGTSTKRFFVRVAGTLAEKKAMCEAAFGPCEYVTVDGLEDEFALVTQTISENKFAQAAKKVEGMITKIRLA